MSYVLNINSGILHTKPCADGETGLPPVAAGSRKHYGTAENARKDKRYKKDHSSVKCMGGVDD